MQDSKAGLGISFLLWEMSTLVDIIVDGDPTDGWMRLPHKVGW